MVIERRKKSAKGKIASCGGARRGEDLYGRQRGESRSKKKNSEETSELVTKEGVHPDPVEKTGGRALAYRIREGLYNPCKGEEGGDRKKKEHYLYLLCEKGEGGRNTLSPHTGKSGIFPYWTERERGSGTK